MSSLKMACVALGCFWPLAVVAMVGAIGFPKGHRGLGCNLVRNPCFRKKAGSEIFSPNPLCAITGPNAKQAA